jgi:cell division protein FtsB
MVRVTLCLQLLLVVWILQQSDADYDQLSKLQEKIQQMEEEDTKLKGLIHDLDQQSARCGVGGYSNVFV